MTPPMRLVAARSAEKGMPRPIGRSGLGSGLCGQYRADGACP